MPTRKPNAVPLALEDLKGLETEQLLSSQVNEQQKKVRLSAIVDPALVTVRYRVTMGGGSDNSFIDLVKAIEHYNKLIGF